MTSSSTRLTLGSTFSVRVRVGMSYVTKNRVLEFEEGRLIAWAHWGGQRWRYELEPQGDSDTLVRETVDWSTSRSPLFVELMGFPKRYGSSMTATLERLAAIVEPEPAAEVGDI